MRCGFGSNSLCRASWQTPIGPIMDDWISLVRDEHCHNYHTLNKPVPTESPRSASTSTRLYASSASFAVLAMVKPIRTRPAATTFAVHPAKPVDSPSIMVMLAWLGLGSGLGLGLGLGFALG